MPAEPGSASVLWLPRPPKFPDHPMTAAEYQACRRRTDLPKRGPHEHPASEQPPAPRALLGETVSVEVSGTVLDALRALMGKSKWDWLASIDGDSADKTAQFAVKDAPLWQALDRLLEVYGYDWGFRAGAVVCWPALTPARARSETPEAAPDAEPPPEGETLEIAEPTRVESVLARFRPVQGQMDVYPTLDARLREWQLAGRMGVGDAERATQQIAAALTAVVEGDLAEGCISMGAHMWLSQALRGADARAVEVQAQGVRLEHPQLRRLLYERLRALFTAQQWRLMDIGGEAVVWFRELPLDVAELWVVTAGAGEAFWTKAAPPGKDWSVDWSRPDEFYACAYYVPDVQQSPTDHLYRVVGRGLNTLAVVISKCGQRREI